MCNGSGGKSSGDCRRWWARHGCLGNWFEGLLRTRILVILDGLSEMPSSADDPGKARPDNPDFPATALIVTSKNEERLRENATIIPSRVDKFRLVTFMSAYVAQGGTGNVQDSELFEACRRLASMLSEGGREATPLLAKLYAEQLVALSESNPIPKNFRVQYRT